MSHYTWLHTKHEMCYLQLRQLLSLGLSHLTVKKQGQLRSTGMIGLCESL